MKEFIQENFELIKTFFALIVKLLAIVLGEDLGEVVGVIDDVTLPAEE